MQRRVQTVSLLLMTDSSNEKITTLSTVHTPTHTIQLIFMTGVVTAIAFVRKSKANDQKPNETFRRNAPQFNRYNAVNRQPGKPVNDVA